MRFKNNHKKKTICSMLLGFTISASGAVSAAGGEYLDYGLHWFKMKNGQEKSVKAVEHDGAVISRDNQEQRLIQARFPFE